MKRLILILAVALIGVAACMAQEPIYYNTSPTILWTPPDKAPDGSDFLAGDTVEYVIYRFEGSVGDQPDILGLAVQTVFVDTDPTTADVNGEESTTVTFPERREWWLCLVATHIDGGGNRTPYDKVLFTSVAGDTSSGVPFVYVPESGAASPGSGPTGLRDAGM